VGSREHAVCDINRFHLQEIAESKALGLLHTLAMHEALTRLRVEALANAVVKRALVSAGQQMERGQRLAEFQRNSA